MYNTWADRSVFDYRGNISTGTTIRYGKNLRNSHIVTAEQWDALITHFQGRTVKLGTSRDNPPEDSVGLWWKENYQTPALMSYIGPILVNEGHAVKNHDGTIRFN